MYLKELPNCIKPGHGVIPINTGKEINTGVFGFLCAECEKYGFSFYESGCYNNEDEAGHYDGLDAANFAKFANDVKSKDKKKKKRSRARKNRKT